MARYLLVDANNILCRSHYGNLELTSEQGHRTGAIFGFLRTLSWVKYEAQVALPNVICVWDGGRSRLRQLLYPEYKQGRSLSNPQTEAEKADAEALKEQGHALQWELLANLPLKQAKVEGVEADDLIGIYSNILQKDGHEPIVFSGDADMHQLVEYGVQIFDPKKGMLSREDIEEKWGVDVEDIVWMKAIMGDSSDNIKGVKGFGEKRAALVAKGAKHAVCRWAKEWGEQELKWVNKLAERDFNYETVTRNLSLMKLPRTFEGADLDDSQAMEALAPLVEKPQGDELAFVASLEKYDLTTIRDELYKWL